MSPGKVLAVSLALAACVYGVTLLAAPRVVSVGMTRAECVRVLGEPREVASEIPGATTLVWGEGDPCRIAFLHDGRVIFAGTARREFVETGR